MTHPKRAVPRSEYVLIERLGSRLRFEPFHAPDDATALTRARAVAVGEEAELWRAGVPIAVWCPAEVTEPDDAGRDVTFRSAA